MEAAQRKASQAQQRKRERLTQRKATRGVAEKGKWILGMIRFPKDKLLKSAPRKP